MIKPDTETKLNKKRLDNLIKKTRKKCELLNVRTGNRTSLEGTTIQDGSYELETSEGARTECPLV